MLDGVTIIDADAHLLERPNLVAPHLEGPWLKGTRRAVFPGDAWDRSMEGKYGFETYDVPTRLKAMDTEGIDVSVLFPTAGMQIGNVRGEPEYVQALCRAYNNFAGSQAREGNGRLRVMALLPPQFPEFAVRELNRCVTDLGAIGAVLPAQFHGRNLGGKEYYPLYEEALRLNVPVCIHSSANGADTLLRFDYFITTHVVGFPFPIMAQCAGMVLGGIPELFPDLRLGFLEAGTGWVPYWADRLDEHFERRSSEAPLLKARPSEYMKSGRIYYGAEGEDHLLPWAMAEMGDGLFLFASDYPHWDCGYPDSARDLMERQDLSDAQKRTVMEENPRRFYANRV